ncbi:O-antigen ligase family protein [Aquipuribacter sp. SD81]|uniref:O-antigen ligase family protein n=1 Tax=Aquipuribacter sp. SD81 TaxID=3127703 RepID=UPI0030167F60
MTAAGQVRPRAGADDDVVGAAVPAAAVLAPSTEPAPLRALHHPAGAAVAALVAAAATGVLVGVGGTAVLAAVVLALGLVAAALAPRFPSALPLLALASAVTPPLVSLPFLVVVGGKSLFLSDVLLPLAVLVALRRRARVPRLELLAWFYAAVMLAQAAVGVVQRQPFEAFTQDLRGPLYVVMGFLVVSRLATTRGARAAVRVALLVLWYTASLMLVTIATGTELLAGRTENVRAFDTVQTLEIDATRFIVNSKGLAFLAVVVGVAVLASRVSTRHQRLLAAACLVPGAVVTFLGYARATMLALALCLLLLGLLARRLGLDWTRLGAALLALAAPAALLVLSGNGSLVNDPDGNALARQVAGFEARVLDGLDEEGANSPGNQYRLLENRYALQAAADNALFGLGIGADYHPRFVQDPTLQAFKANPDFGSRFIHNGWLWYLVKTGAVGLVAALLLFFVPVLRAVGGRVPPAGTGVVAIALAVGLVGLMVIHLFEPDIHRVGTAPLFGAALGYLSLVTTASRRPSANAGATT